MQVLVALYCFDPFAERICALQGAITSYDALGDGEPLSTQVQKARDARDELAGFDRLRQMHTKARKK